jgi:hypothetical protein
MLKPIQRGLENLNFHAHDKTDGCDWWLVLLLLLLRSELLQLSSVFSDLGQHSTNRLALNSEKEKSGKKCKHSRSLQK